MSKPFIICLVDDDYIYRFTVAKIIKNHNLAREIITFENGEEALHFLLENMGNTNKKLPDIIFLDINMPIMDGFQFMEEYLKIKSQVSKKITIYMVSSSVDPVDIDRAKTINELSDYIIKPIKPEQLSKIVEALES